MENYYEILGVGRHALEAEIKKAYRINAIKYHPDKNFGDVFFEEKFKIINEAYSVLNDPIRKKEYDAKWDEQLGSKYNRSTDQFTSSTTFKQATPEEKEFNYNPHKPFYSFQDRFIHETPQYKPKVDHWGNSIPEDVEFFKLPKNIGKIISGYSNYIPTKRKISNSRLIKDVLIAALIGLAIGSGVIFFFNVENLVWMSLWLVVPSIGLGWLMTPMPFKAYENFIGINGFAEYECQRETSNFTKNIEINFTDITDLVSISRINKTNLTYTSTTYLYVWLKNGKVELEVNKTHDSKEGDPDKDRYPEYWLHRVAEKYWTLYLMDNMESTLQKQGFLTFNIVKQENNGAYTLEPYLRLGIGFIEFFTEKGLVKYQFNDIKNIYSKGSTLYIEHNNFEKILYFFKSGNRNEIPLLNLSNRDFFFKSMEILLGYSLQRD